MVNLLEMLYAITALAVLTAIYFAMRERKTQLERDRYKGALWMSAWASLLARRSTGICRDDPGGVPTHP